MSHVMVAPFRACFLTGLFSWEWHTGDCCGFISWNCCTIFCCGSFIECFLFSSEAGWPRCIWVAVCPVVKSLSYSSSFIPTLQSEWEDLRQAPSTFCPSLSFSDTLSLHFFSVAVFLFPRLFLQSPSSTTILKWCTSILSLTDGTLMIFAHTI